MRDIDRREWHAIVLGGLTAALPRAARGAAKIDSKVGGVQLGAQSYSFRDRPLDAAIQGLAAVGLGSVELWQGHLEPRTAQWPPPEEERKALREKVRKWRLTTPLGELEAIGRKFADAGIEVYAYNVSFRDDFSDEEIDRGFQMAKAMGAKVITASANQKTVPRIDRFARKHRMRVGLHNHSRLDPNEFATAEDLEKAMAASSEFICTNLDIGHFTAANQDAVAFLQKNHGRTVTIHVKDRKRDQGKATPFGEGDAPIKDVLRLIGKNRWPIPANIEYEYEGRDTVEEVRRCVAYCKNALARSVPE